ncbi:MAG: hypothetical protein HKN26_03995, partial [Acidimicrobiales bacterium]|nr:hypothetical protein [Acidimicrobiales bacterium]
GGLGGGVLGGLGRGRGASTGQMPGGCGKGGGGGLIMIIVVVGVIFLMSRGCSGAGLGGTSLGGGGGDDSNRIGERTELIRAEPINRDQLSNAERQRMDDLAITARDDINAYWNDVYQQTFGEPYSPPQAAFPFDPDGNERISCGQPLPNEILKNNAIFCPPEDYVTWDARYLFPKLYENFGDAAMTVVLAHEWGHAVQFKAGVTGPTILKELQADCLAGAWVGSIQNGESPDIDPFSAAELDGSVAGFLLLRDPPGLDPLSEGAHGTGFDRVGAYEDGFLEGPSQCARYGQVEGLPRITDLAFAAEDEGGQGNLDLDETLDFTLAGLNSFWGPEISRETGEDQLSAEPYWPSRGDSTPCREPNIAQNPVHWCDGAGRIYFDADQVAKVHNDLGDFAVALLFAREYGNAQIDFAQFRGAEVERDLVAHCLGGVWARAVFGGQLQVGFDDATDEPLFLELSPSDLDEALAVMLRFRRPGDDASLFARTDAFQDGFFEGEASCGLS